MPYLELYRLSSVGAETQASRVDSGENVKGFAGQENGGEFIKYIAANCASNTTAAATCVVTRRVRGSWGEQFLAVDNIVVPNNVAIFIQAEFNTARISMRDEHVSGGVPKAIPL